jgi:glycerol-3-phosphate acyltransferase PlsY
LSGAALLGLLISYLVGGIPLGLLLCKAWKGVDPREFGSGNIGATNISRILGPAGGALVFLMDVAKGAVAVEVARRIAGPVAGPWLPILAAVAALAGNNWPVWLKFKGGKGASISLGIGLAVAWKIALLAFAVWIVLALTTRYISIASIGAVAVAPFFAYFMTSPTHRLPLVAFTLGVAALVIYKHRVNILRLRNGTEPKFRGRGPGAGDQESADKKSPPSDKEFVPSSSEEPSAQDAGPRPPAPDP